jgi:hypothetical protein
VLLAVVGNAESVDELSESLAAHILFGQGITLKSRRFWQWTVFQIDVAPQK